MASHRRRRPITIIVLLVALCLFVHSAEAGFLSTLRQKVLALTLSDGNEAPTAVPDQAVVEKKPKREGKRVAIIGTYPLPTSHFPLPSYPRTIRVVVGT